MTEPVAYLNKYLDNSTNITRYKPENQRLLSSNPLYTAEDLHPRVKMTKAEHDEFNKLLLSSAVTIYEVIDTIYKDNGKMNDFSHLYQRLFNRNDKLELENQLEFSKLWANFNIENPEETIEIVPDMKWFVRSKKSELNGYGWLSIIDKYQTPIYQYSENRPFGNAVGFDTKEEAEFWTNPLTAAVQLPVEGE